MMRRLTSGPKPAARVAVYIDVTSSPSTRRPYRTPSWRAPVLDAPAGAVRAEADSPTTPARTGAAAGTAPPLPRAPPTTPRRAAGGGIAPPVSEPKAAGTKPGATAAALPPLDPPGTRDGSWGLRVGPKAEFSVDDPMANSSRLVLPTTTAPAARR